VDNLPLGVFSTDGGEPRTAVRIGDLVLDPWESGHEDLHRLGSSARSPAGSSPRADRSGVP
jgi:hypothetical protein